MKNICKENEPDGGQVEMMRLVGELSRLFRCEVRRDCEKNGVPVGYRGVLFHLAREGGQTQKELSEKTGVRPASMSVTIDKMQRDGYVYREKDALDARVVHVFLTEKGEQLDRRNRERVGQLEKRFSSVVSPEERETLTKLLQKVINGYLAQSGGDCPGGEK